MTLVILAAGMGSRYGGLKQIDPITNQGEFIIDFSVYDAIQAGFDKVVFVIKRENLELFRETVGTRFESRIKVEYAFQELTDIPVGYSVPEERVKPWGTAHALLAARELVTDPFMVINSDDFYGRSAYRMLADHFKNGGAGYAMVGYIIGNTLTENGSVKRGYCESKDGYLTNLIESSVYKDGDKVKVEPLDGRESFYADTTDLVSMNMFCFKPDMIDYLDKHFIDFFEANKEDLSKCEYLIPDIVFERIDNKDIKVRVVDTDAVWHGVTYKEDKEDLVNCINNLIEIGEYPNNLYE